MVFSATFYNISVIYRGSIQLMTFDEVNTRIDQPMEKDIHRGINPCIHRNGKSLTVLLYDIKLNLN